MPLYLAVKHLHVTCVVLSIAGFFLRGLLMLRDSPLLERRWIRILPHVNDTVLLAAALTLSWLGGVFPFVDAWLTAKVFGLIAYIILGVLALQPGRSKPLRMAAWGGALATIGWVVSVALTRHPAGVFYAVFG